MVREVFVADTDEEAWKLSAGGMMGRMMREYFLPLLSSFRFLEFLKHEPDVPDSDVTPEYCAKHNWLVGSPSTVAEQLRARSTTRSAASGRCWCSASTTRTTRKAWQHSMELLAKEVMPKFKGLVPK